MFWLNLPQQNGKTFSHHISKWNSQQARTPCSPFQCNELNVEMINNLKMAYTFLLLRRHSLVTQPMLQLRPNCTELRSMDYYLQIFCRFRKCKQKVPPPSLLSNDFKKSWIFSKFLVMFLFSLIKIFWPYKDFVQNLRYCNVKTNIWVIWKKHFSNKIFKSWFEHVCVWVKNLLLLLLTFLSSRWHFWNNID